MSAGLPPTEWMGRVWQMPDEELRARVAELMGTLAWCWVIDGCSRSRPYETAEEAEADKPNLERRFKVGSLVLDSEVPKYTGDMAAAWEVFDRACSEIFSVRGRFLSAIQQYASHSVSAAELIAWPDVLSVARKDMPKIICMAAVAVLCKPE